MFFSCFVLDYKYHEGPLTVTLKRFVPEGNMGPKYFPSNDVMNALPSQRLLAASTMEAPE